MTVFLLDYGLFFAKVATVLLAALILIGFVFFRRGEPTEEGHIEVLKLNDQLDDLRDTLRESLLDDDQLKREDKALKAKKKAKKKLRRKEAKLARKRLGGKQAEPEQPERSSVYVLNFDGDIRASANECLRREITSVLAVARHGDEVIVCLESPGGMVHSYGLASSQLDRIIQAKIPLTVCVDKVAASGGYMMACVANRIVAAPFAILGSIGVVAQLPNFHRLLKKNDIDVELLTAGEYKRTLTMLGENTEEGRKKFTEELEDTHALFKEFVSEHRPKVDIEKVATGETWYGKRALGVNLIDEIKTSDELLLERCKEADVYEIRYAARKTLREKLGLGAADVLDAVAIRWWERLQSTRFPR